MIFLRFHAWLALAEPPAANRLITRHPTPKSALPASSFCGTQTNLSASTTGSRPGLWDFFTAKLFQGFQKKTIAGKGPRPSAWTKALKNARTLSLKSAQDFV
jgi:hypothetical protein